MDYTAEIEGIAVGVDEEGANVPAVILSAREEYLPIFVTADQAQSIRLGLRDEPFERPLTHDLIVEMITEFGGAVDGVRIDDLTDGTFYAKIDIQQYDDGEAHKFVFDARPSDGVALAVRADAPIAISDEILDEAGRPQSELEFDESDAEGLPPGEEGEPLSEGSEDDPFSERSGEEDPFAGEDDPFSEESGEDDPFSGESGEDDPFSDDEF